MANTRSQSRRASSVQPPQALSSETKPETETEASIKLEPVPPHRLGSPSLLRATPQVQPQSKVKVEPSSPINSYISPAAHTSPESNSDTDTVSDSESQPQVKVEVVSDYDEDEDEARDEVPELSHFAALRLADVPRSKSKGPGSVMSTEDAQSTIDSWVPCSTPTLLQYDGLKRGNQVPRVPSWIYQQTRQQAQTLAIALYRGKSTYVCVLKGFWWPPVIYSIKISQLIRYCSSASSPCLTRNQSPPCPTPTPTLSTHYRPSPPP